MSNNEEFRVRLLQSTLGFEYEKDTREALGKLVFPDGKEVGEDKYPVIFYEMSGNAEEIARQAVSNSLVLYFAIKGKQENNKDWTKEFSAYIEENYSKVFNKNYPKLDEKS